MEHHDIGADKGAAFTGLIMGAVLLFLLLFTIAAATHRHYLSVEAHEARAGAPADGAGPAK